MNIYSILSSKPHIPHHLHRYCKFIEYCQNLIFEGYTEIHHICPKAKDMFPEYKDLSIYDWNSIALPPRHHYISHIMLWNAFPEIQSCRYALWYMSNNPKWSSHQKYSKTYDKLRKANIDVWKEAGSRVGKTSIGHVPVYDPDLGKIIKIPNTDIRYTSGLLKHHTVGNKVGKTIDGEIVWTSIDDNRFQNGELVHINAGMTPAKDQDGNMLQVAVDDPGFLSGELTHNTKDTIWINNGIIERTIHKFSLIPSGWTKGRITTNAANTIWIRNKKTGIRKRINPSDFETFQSLGFERGR